MTTKIKFQKLMMVILCSLSIQYCFSQNQNENSIVFTQSIKGDATPEVLKKVMQLQNDKPVSIVFEKGTYNFYPDKALESYCFISNHNGGLVRTAFPLFSKKNITIDGQGSTFIFHGKMIPFFVQKSENIKIKNLSIDWATPFSSEGLVVANDLVNKTFDIQFSPEYPYVIKNDQLVFVKEYYEHGIGQAIMYDPIRKAIAYDTESYTPLTEYNQIKTKFKVESVTYKYKMDTRAPEFNSIKLENRLIVKEIKPGLVRVFNHTNKIPLVGMILVCKGSQHENRLAPAIRVVESLNFSANNVNIHHAGGMGLIVENSENIDLDNFNITPSNGRMVSTTADATHFVGCRGKIDIQNCTFNNQLDDACNVHGTYQEVVEVINENTLGVMMGHFQQQDFSLGRPNDTIGLVRLKDSFFAYHKLSLKSTENINGRYHILTFNEKLPANIEVGDYLENMDAYPELTIRNCNIANNRARGLLLSTPKKTIIDHNFFSTEMEAILVPVESGFWYESGSALDLTITNNTFQDCTHSGQNRGVIRFETDDKFENVAFKNIKICDNTFNQFDNFILEVNNVDNLLFKNNTITNSGTFPMLFPENPAIRVHTSKNIVFEKNTYKGKAKPILTSDKFTPKLKFK